MVVVVVVCRQLSIQIVTQLELELATGLSNVRLKQEYLNIKLENILDLF